MYLTSEVQRAQISTENPCSSVKSQRRTVCISVVKIAYFKKLRNRINNLIQRLAWTHDGRNEFGFGLVIAANFYGLALNFG